MHGYRQKPKKTKLMLLLPLFVAAGAVGFFQGSKSQSSTQTEVQPSTTQTATVKQFISCINEKDFKCSHDLMASNSPDIPSFEQHQQELDPFNIYEEPKPQITEPGSKNEVHVSAKGEINGEYCDLINMVFWLEPLDSEWRIVKLKVEKGPSCSTGLAPDVDEARIKHSWGSSQP